MSRQQWDPQKEQDGGFGYIVVIVPSSWGSRPIPFGPYSSKAQAKQVLEDELESARQKYQDLRVRGYWYKLGKANS